MWVAVSVRLEGGWPFCTLSRSPGTHAGTDSLSSGVLPSRSPLWGQGLDLKGAVQGTEHKYNFCGAGEDVRLGVGRPCSTLFLEPNPPLVP